MNLKDKFKGSILGMAMADSLAFKKCGGTGYSSELQLCLCVAKTLCSCKAATSEFQRLLAKNFIDWSENIGDSEIRKNAIDTNLASFDALKNSIPLDEIEIMSPDTGATARAMPIGLYWNDIITKSIQFGILSCEISHTDMNSKCSAVAAALGTLLASKNVPTGCWANEITAITSGIDKEFVESIKLASKIAANKTTPEESKKIIGPGHQCNESIAIALYSCMSEPFSWKDAVTKAIDASDNPCSSGCIAGGWMGAKFGIQGLPPEVDSLERKSDLEMLAEKLYDEYVFRKKNINDYQLMFD
jgi:ADP-ribosylglycohydrolase